MRSIKLLILIAMSLTCSFASHTGGGTQEINEPFMRLEFWKWKLSVLTGGGTQETKEPSIVETLQTLRSFDDRTLQLALRAKLAGNARIIELAREPLVFLRGIDGVRVIISPQLKEYGLTEEAVKTSIDLRLRRNGIKLYDTPDDPNSRKAFMISHPDSVFFMAGLLLTIDSISLSKTNIVAASVDLSQSQIMNLLSAENPTFVVPQTWHAGEQVIGSRENIARGCRESTDDLVDKYCNDWLATHTDQKTGKIPQDQSNTASDR